MLGNARILRDWLRDDALRWGVPATVAEIVLLLPIIGGVAVALTRLDRDLFSWLLKEDSVVEWSQFALFLAAAFFGARAVRVSWSVRGGKEALVLSLFVLGCLVVAGEEISWGQRILGLETPELLEGTNVQGEFNAHNVLEVRTGLKFAMIGVGLYGFVAPWLVRMRAWRPGPRLELAVPPLFLSSSFLVLAGYNLGRLAFFPQGFFGVEENLTLGRFGEWPELCLAFALAFYALLIWRRSRIEAVFLVSRRVRRRPGPTPSRRIGLRIDHSIGLLRSKARGPST
jgi:hypothetical protein